MSRELTAYEKDKWFSEYNHFYYDSFEGDNRYARPNDLFLLRGDEHGEAFDDALAVATNSDYLPDEFVTYAQTVVLDYYYDQLSWFYIDDASDGPEYVGLPSRELLIEKAKEFGVDEVVDYRRSDIRTDEERKLWDWAMEWRTEHWEETLKQRKIEELESKLENLKND